MYLIGAASVADAAILLAALAKEDVGPVLDPDALRRGQLLPQVSDHCLQRRDLLRLRPDQRITRIPGRHIGHSPQSSRKPRSPRHGNTTPDAGT